jgi:hypothetical protein
MATNEDPLFKTPDSLGGAVGPGQYFGRPIPRPNEAGEAPVEKADPAGKDASEFGVGPNFQRPERHALPGEFAPDPHTLEPYEVTRLLFRTDPADPTDGVDTLAG